MDWLSVACWPKLSACLASPIATVGPGGQPLEQLLGGVVEFGPAYRLVDQSPVGRIASRPPSHRAAASAWPAPAPTSRGSSQVEPESGLKPRSTNGSQNTASVAATVKSAASARLQPNPTAHPCTLHTTGSWMLCDQLDHAVGGMGNPPHQIAGAGALPAGIVGGHPVGAGAEVVSGAPDVDRAQRIVGGGIGQRVDQSPDHQVGQRVTPGWAIERDPQNRAIAARCHRTLGVGRVGLMTHRRIRPFSADTVTHTVGNTIDTMYKLARIR